MSRINTLRDGTARKTRLTVAIRAAARSTSRGLVCTVRITPDGVTAYDWRPDRVFLPRGADNAIRELMCATRPDIDWTVSHDYHLITGMLRRSPEVGERGYTPEVEGTFGGTDPVFLPRPADSRSAA